MWLKRTHLRPSSIPNGVSLTVTLIGTIRGQPRKVAMFGIKLKVLKRSGRFYDLKEYSSLASTPLLNWVKRGKPVEKAVFSQSDPFGQPKVA